MSKQEEKITNSFGERLREFKLTSLAVDNAVTVYLITFMIMVFGIQSYNDMPKEQFPEASLPTVFVNTPYFGNSAREIETFITRPIEKEIQNISGLKYVTSTSLQDFSVIISEFDSDLEMSDVVRKIKDAVDKAKSELPDDLDTDPEVLEINFSEIPIVTINISGDIPADELKEYGEFVKERLEGLRQVSEINLKGALDKEVQVDIDLLKMQSLQVSYTDIENAIAFENMTMSGGEIVAKDFRRAVRVIGQFDDVTELANIIVKAENQRPIYLKDIATVKLGYKERTSYARAESAPVVSLDIIKRRGENLLAAAVEIDKIVEEVKEILPKELNISSFNDQSVATRDGVNNLENSIISGVILVILVLLFFLGLRNSLFVGLAIPLSMLMGIMILHATGTTMNIVVLFSLILALGLLVDNGIVVVENIYRYMQDGYSGSQAAKFGASEVAWPIIASTGTTLAAFLPLAFWPGIMGTFLQYMPLTLIIVLSSSLFVALVINPVFTSKFMKVDEKLDNAALRKRKRRNVIIGAIICVIIAVLAHFVKAAAADPNDASNTLRNVMGLAAILSLLNYFVLRPLSFIFQERGLPRLERVYNKFITFILKGWVPSIALFGTFVLLIVAFMLFVTNMPAVKFFPDADPIYVNVFVETPLGRDIEGTNDVMLKIEQQISKVIEEDMGIVESVLSQVGENTADPNAPPEPGVTPHKGRITVAFVPSSDRGGKSSKKTMENIRAAVKGYPGVKVTVDQNASGPPTGKAINMEVTGENIDSLLVLSDNIKKFLDSKSIPGIEGLSADVSLSKPELLVNIDRTAARRYELSTAQIASSLRTSIFGKEVSKFKDGDEDYPIVIRLDENYRSSVTDLLNQKITFRNPANGRIAQVPVSAVADVEYSSTYSSIKRKDGDRLVAISSNVLDGYNANEIVAELKGLMDDYEFAEGYGYEFTGEQQQQAEDMAFLSTAFLLALFLIFIILVAQFNSIISPFIIIFSVVFSTIGVFLGYVITQDDISVIFTFVGVISLAGVVVNNAIVLVDYINLLIKRKRIEKGHENMSDLDAEDVKQAIIQGGATRLRPVLLTAITTILGLYPLAIGFNFNFFTFLSHLDPEFFIGGDNAALWGPMAWTIIYGLTFATFLTLVVVPVMYWLAYRGKTGFSNLRKRFAPKPIVESARDILDNE